MKNYLYISIVALSCAVSSCVTPFDPDYDENPVIFVEAFPGLDADHVDLKIMPAYSKSNTPVVTPFKPDIMFAVNGTVLQVERSDAGQGHYVVDYEPVSGDKLTLSVISDGFPTVYAETVIPAEFPDRRIDYRKVESGLDSYDNVLFVTINEIDMGCAYGLQICNEARYDSPEEQNIVTYRYAGNLYPDDSGYDELIAPSLDAVDFALKGEYLWAWNGASLIKDEVTFAVQPSTYGSSDEAFESFFVHEEDRDMYDEEGNITGTYRYTCLNKLVLYTMTEEFYKYRVADELQGDYSGFAGVVAPTNYCYSNIDGGYGAFAGVRIVETDWITKEFIESNR